MIQPEDKRPDEPVQTTLPAAYAERVRAHGKDLNDSSPEHVLRAIVKEYFDAGRDRETTNGNNPRTEKPAHRVQTASANGQGAKGGRKGGL